MIEPQIAAVIDSVSTTLGVDPNLVTAIVMQESGGDSHATRFEKDWHYFADPRTGGPTIRPAVQGVGKCTAATEQIAQMMSWGLMQPMGSVARERGFRGDFLSELIDPEVGLTYGIKHLKHFMDRYTLNSAIGAYNGGVGIIATTDVKLIAKRESYVASVLGYMKDIQLV